MLSPMTKECLKNWELSSLLGGKASSYQGIREELSSCKDRIAKFSFSLPHCYEEYQEIDKLLSEMSAVIGCLTSIDVTDDKATQIEADVSRLQGDFAALTQKLDQKLADLSSDEFEKLLSKLSPISFYLKERRQLIQERMPLEKELLVTDLSVSGLNAYTTLYYTFIGSLKFPLNGKEHNISQIENLLDNSDRSIREGALKSMEEVLTKNEAIFAQILNNILDFRLTVYRNRGTSSYLHESLRLNRIQEKTLNAMWKAVSKHKDLLVQYMNKKASLLGLKKLSWFDLDAPLGNKEEAHIPWEVGCERLLKEFETVSPKMAVFAKKALNSGWVDATVSDKKRAGGFCTSMPQSRETRIFMSYADSFSNLSTLAHELGHAFHAEVLYKKPPVLQSCPINVCEAASTMCEMILADSALRQAKSPREKLLLLDDKIGRYLAFAMDLHSRFLFDSKIHETRKERAMAPEELTAFMVESEKTGFAGALDSYFPHFWCYKMHFYFADFPFYNWTYTFGYLFSLATYQTLLGRPDFEERYIALLEDSGCMQIEDLAKKHLGVDLTQPEFWEKGIESLNSDIKVYLSL